MEAFNRFQQALSSSFEAFAQAVASYLPNLITALLLLLLGWVLASLIKTLIQHFGSRIDRLAARLQPAQDASQEALQPTSHQASLLAARVAYWIVLLFFVAAAVEPLGLPGLVDWINQLVLLTPRLLIAALILLFGYLLGKLAHDLIRSAAKARGVGSASALAIAAQGLIIAFAVVLSVGQVGLDNRLLVYLVTITVGSILGGIGLAFGLGASLQVSNLLASHHMRKIYRPGHKVRIGEHEGEILELTTTAVILETERGRVLIPAKLFSDNASLLLNDETSYD